MTQTVLGHKPGVGPVLKCLKYDADDAMTLPNNAFDRYIFNSENTNLTYTYASEPLPLTNAFVSTLPAQFSIYGGSIVGLWTDASYWRRTRATIRYNVLYPEISYPPISELREVRNGRISAGTRRLTLDVDQGNKEEGYVTQYQFNTVTSRVVGFDGTYGNLYNGVLPSDYSGLVGVGERVVFKETNVYKDGSTDYTLYPNIYNLPADATPMPTYSYVPGLVGFEASPTQFKLMRPGASIYESGMNKTIVDSNFSPALCVMSGERSGVNAIPANGSVFLPAPTGVILSETAVLDFMYKLTDQEWYVPGYIRSGYVKDQRFDLSYSVASNGITVYNEGTAAVDIRYFVSNVDRAGTSSGGNQIMFRGNDGVKDFIQFKKPGTSDPASRPNDILFDSRYPTLHILKEGYVSLAEFATVTDANEARYYGLRRIDIPFENNGLIPYLKFSICYLNAWTPPYMKIQYKQSTGWGYPSNRSMLGRVNSNSVSIWANPGAWTDTRLESGNVSYVHIDPDPIGVRYYIFGIPQT